MVGIFFTNQSYHGNETIFKQMGLAKNEKELFGDYFLKWVFLGF